MRKVFALINPNARVKKRRSFLTELPNFLGKHNLALSRTVQLHSDEPFESQAEHFVSEAKNEGISSLIAVGGDGTVNLLAQAMVQDPAEMTLGAIGIGSSNDFHKPSSLVYRGMPFRLNFDQTIPTDLARVDTPDRTFHFVNALGLGFVAEANQRFNQATPLLRFFKKLNISAAISYAVLQQLVRSNRTDLWMEVDGGPRQYHSICNFNLTKTPHIAGDLLYEKLVQRDDGLLALHRLDACSKAYLVRVLVGLLRGRFIHQPATYSTTIRSARIGSQTPFCFEVDGEVYRTTELTVSVEAQKLQVAS